MLKAPPTPLKPHRWPVFTLLSLLLAICGFAGMLLLWQQYIADEDEAFYMRSLLISNVLKYIPYAQDHPFTFRERPGNSYHQTEEVTTPADWDRRLRRTVYRKGTLAQIFALPLVATGMLALLLLPLGISADRRYDSRAYYGEYIRGSESISRREQNRRKGSDGFRLRVK